MNTHRQAPASTVGQEAGTAATQSSKMGPQAERQGPSADPHHSRPVSPQRTLQPAPLEAILAAMASRSRAASPEHAAAPQAPRRTHRRSLSTNKPGRADALPGGQQQGSAQGTGDALGDGSDSNVYLDPIFTALRATELTSMYNLDLTYLRNKWQAERAHREYVPW